jgi:hypothetical protein
MRLFWHLKAALIADRAGRRDAPRRCAFKLTKEREIGSYQWVHPDDHR